jgi:carboxypeptidase Taq
MTQAKKNSRRATGTRRAPGRKSANRRSPEAKLDELKQRLQEINDLGAAGALLGWDQQTYMPDGGSDARGRQRAMLGKLSHERSVDPALGKLIDELAPYADRLPYDSDDASLVRIARRDFEKAVKVPPEFVARSNAHGSTSYDAWTRAKPENDFARMVPILEKTIALSREYAGFFAPYKHIADPLIDDADPGMTTASIRKLFADLRSELVPIMHAVSEQPIVDDGCLHGSFAEPRQIDFDLSVIDRLGYDRRRGRLDKTHHPFCTKFSIGDVRITTRVNENDVSDSLFTMMHETGHALYEQGVSTTLEATPLGWGTSSGVHESQSRLWENVVGRSRGFWVSFLPELKRAFPGQLDSVPLETFYRAVNKVQRSLIRTESDELTYNLHIMLRCDLEVQMLEGRLAVKDLPDAWRARMRADLGLEPPDDRTGCLQDVHWYSGLIGGGFQSYTIGNILSAQFYTAAVKARPEIPRDTEQGTFATLHAWLRDNIYQYGRKFEPNELIARTTGGPLSMQPYLAYLRRKYGELYRLPPPQKASKKLS